MTDKYNLSNTTINISWPYSQCQSVNRPYYAALSLKKGHLGMSRFGFLLSLPITPIGVSRIWPTREGSMASSSAIFSREAKQSGQKSNQKSSIGGM